MFQHDVKIEESYVNCFNSLAGKNTNYAQHVAWIPSRIGNSRHIRCKIGFRRSRRKIIKKPGGAISAGLLGLIGSVSGQACMASYLACNCSGVSA